MYFKKRNKTYHLFYKDKAEKICSISTKCSLKKDAQQFAVEYFKNEEKKALEIKERTLRQFEDFYCKYASTRFSKSYQELLFITFKQFKKVVDENKLLSEINILDIENFISIRKLSSGERIINGYLRTLQAAFERAVEFGMIEKNVFTKVKKLKAPINTPLFLTREDFEKLLEYENEERFRFIYKFALYTGMRMSEIIYLRWASIHFINKNITVENHDYFTTKSKKSRDIPLHPILNEDLLKMKGELKNYVFLYDCRQYNKNLISKNFKAAVRRAKLNDKYHFHTLRHTFASWLVQKGVSIYEVSKLLGHADIKTTEIYAHLQENNLRQSIDLL